MGPIVIIISKVFMDVITISSMYIIVLFSFTSGLLFILGTEKILSLKCKKFLALKPGGQGAEEEILANFNGSFAILETMFWSWLGPGQDFKESDNSDSVSSKGPLAIGAVFMPTYMHITRVYYSEFWKKINCSA